MQSGTQLKYVDEKILFVIIIFFYIADKSNEVIIIFVLNIVACLFMMGVNFSSGIFPAYLKSFGAAEIVISLSVTALYLTRGTASILVNKISKTIKFKNLFIIAFLGSIISTTLFMVPNNPVVIASLRAFQGLFSGLYWVLINIYAISLGTNTFNKFKNLSTVTICLNIGGFFGAYLGGKIASTYSVDKSFCAGIIILIIGAISCLFLEDIKEQVKSATKSVSTSLTKREKLILLFAILSSSIFAYISIGIPLFILQLGGSYKEIGTATGIGILSAATIISIAPWLRKKFSYRTIMKVDYSLIIITLFTVFYFKSIILIYFLQGILTGVSSLERNLWFSVLQEYSNNYNRAISLLRGFNDYLGAILFLVYGYFIQNFGAASVAAVIGVITFLFLLAISFYKKLNFLKNIKPLRILGIAHFNHILKKVDIK